MSINENEPKLTKMQKLLQQSKELKAERLTLTNNFLEEQISSIIDKSEKNNIDISKNEVETNVEDVKIDKPVKATSRIKKLEVVAPKVNLSLQDDSYQSYLEQMHSVNHNIKPFSANLSVDAQTIDVLDSLLYHLNKTKPSNSRKLTKYQLVHNIVMKHVRDYENEVFSLGFTMPNQE